MWCSSEHQVVAHPATELGIVEQQRQQARLEFLAELGDPGEQRRLSRLVDSELAQLPALARSSRIARNSS